MTGREELEARLAEGLSVICEGLTPLEAALLIANILREADSCEYAIEAQTDGGFSVMRSRKN